MRENKANVMSESRYSSVLKGIVAASALFCMVMSVLLIANRVQSAGGDFVNTPALKVLMEAVPQNPNDEMLREQVRELNLLARKAYFTTAWQQRTGTVMLLAGLALLALAVKLLQSMHSTIDLPGNAAGEDAALNLLSRRWILVSGLAPIVVALAVSFIPQPEIRPVVADATGRRDTVEHANKAVAHGLSADREGKPASLLVGTEHAEQVEPLRGDEIENTAAADPEPGKAFPEALWPNFRGPGGNGTAYVRDVPVEWDAVSGDCILWRAEIPLKGNSSPVIAGDRLFVTGGNKTSQEVFCYDVATGALQWRTVIPGNPSEAGRIHEDTGYAPNTPATDGKHVCAIYPTGALACLDFSGLIVWTRQLGVPDNHYGHASSLIIHDGLLIVQWDQNQNARLLGIDMATGETVWETERTAISWSSPICVNTGKRFELILTNSKSVTSYDPLTGKALWNVDCMGGEMGPSAAYANGYVYAANDYATAAAIRIADSGAELVWENDDELPDTASPVATDRHVYIAASYAVIACLNALTGEMLWSQEFDNGFYASPIRVADSIYALDMQGDMHIFKATGDAYEEIGTGAVGESCVATPAFTDGRLYIRGEKHLFCIGSE